MILILKKFQPTGFLCVGKLQVVFLAASVSHIMKQKSSHPSLINVTSPNFNTKELQKSTFHAMTQVGGLWPEKRQVSGACR
jgi:hypothetical protein